MKNFGKVLALLLVPVLLSGCTAKLVGKLDDYNEIAVGKVSMDGMGAAKVNVNFEKQGIACHGLAVHIYTPPSNVLAQTFLIPKCTGQQGYVIMECDDASTFKVSYEVIGPFCGEIAGSGFDAYNRKFSYYANLKDNRTDPVLEKYRQDVKDKPLPVKPTQK